MSVGDAPPVFELSPQALHHRLRQAEPLLLLDVRRPESLAQQPCGIRGAVPVILKPEGPDLPDMDRGIEIVIYDGDDDSTGGGQVARWLAEAGYRHLWQLDGGLAAWRAANLPVWQMRFGARRRKALNWTPLARLAAASPTPSGAADAAAFLRGLCLPSLREVVALRVGVIETIVSSSRSEAALAQVQRLMQCVVSTASRHPAEVHDFEGDGTILYFAEPGAALRAAFEMRRELCAARSANDSDSVPLVRLALDSAPMTLGHVGPSAASLRCLIGPCLSTVLRILDRAPPGGIVATERVLTLGGMSEPELSTRFKRMPTLPRVRSTEASLPLFLSQPGAFDLAGPEPASCKPPPSGHP